MKTIMIVFGVFLFFIGATQLYFDLSKKNRTVSKIYVENPVNKDKELYAFADKVMQKVKVNLSVTKKDILINKIVTITNRFFSKQEDKEAFVIILSIESKFNQDVKSSAGAVGMAQLLPKYFQDFAKICNLQVDNKDIYDVDINLTVGACYFNSLLKENNSTLLAVAAYNAGLNSPAVKGLKKLGLINQETSNYVARFAMVQEYVKADK